MTKVLIGFQFITSSLVHILCCGLPILLSVGGGLSAFILMRTFTPILLAVQLIVFGLTFYQLYRPTNRASKSIKNQRIIFWLLSLISVVLFIYPPLHWFKSEETKLKQAQIERFFKHKTQ